MKVFFSKLDNGDWICYDYNNTTGDLFVDPLYIEKLFDQVKHPSSVIRGGATGQWVTIMQDITYDLLGFGLVTMNTHITVVDGEIREARILGGGYAGGDEIARSKTCFVMDLTAMPDFEPYQYPETGEDNDASSGS